MGSLMAGWQTVPKNNPQASLKRCSSLTNEEVSKYWKAKQNSIREHLEEAQMAAGFINPYKKFEMNDDSYGIKEEGIVSLPSAPTLNGPQDEGAGKKADWWTKSKFAYLNEPPLVNDTKQNRYMAQFDVAVKGLNQGAAAGKNMVYTKSATFYLY